MKRSNSNSKQRKRSKKSIEVPVVLWNTDWDRQQITCTQCNQKYLAWNLLFDCPDNQLYLNCPLCTIHLMTVDYSKPSKFTRQMSDLTGDDVKYYDNRINRIDDLNRIKFLANVQKSELKSADQLPEINSDHIIIVWRCNEMTEQIEICHGNIILWKEVRTFQHHERYLKVGQILKEKYGTRLKDFVPHESTWLYLYGDYGPAISMVKDFRNSLQRGNEI